MVDHRQRFQNLMPLVLFVVLIVLSYFIVKPFLIALFLAALLAYIFNPVYFWLREKTKRPNLSAFLICILIFLLIIIPAGFFVNGLIQQSYSFYIFSKQKLATGIFQDCQSQMCITIENFISDPQVSFQIERLSQSITSYFVEKGSELLKTIPMLIMNGFIIFFTLFFFLRDGKNFVDRIGYYLSMKQKSYALVIGRLKEITHGIVYGYVLIAMLQGFLGGLGFLILGLPSPLFWGIVMALLALIPYLGTGFVWVPASIILIVNGIYQDQTTVIIKGVILLAYGFLVVSSIDNFLRPKIIGDKAKIHPALILIGIFGGIYFFGPLGVIIGPMVLSITAVIIEVYLGKKPSKKEIKEALKTD
ncbi:MAG: AI-2E family transporter [Nanoarchaeota archaeon]|nr:AI-2E family transporter [Nanoarchaeota archaeon]